MKITIPYNIYIFLWCLLGVGVFGYGYVKDLADGVSLFTTRQFYTELFIPLAFLYYCVGYVKDRLRNGSSAAIISAAS